MAAFGSRLRPFVASLIVAFALQGSLAYRSFAAVTIMRPAALLTLAVSVALASCASPSPATDWSRNQRLRLERMHQPRSLDEALAQVLARAPNVALMSAEELPRSDRPTALAAPAALAPQEPNRTQEPPKLD